MTRRASLPGVDELFRSSKTPEAGSVPEDTNQQGAKEPAPPPIPAPAPPPRLPEPVTVAHAPAPAAPPPAAAPTGDAGRRPRHEEKVTFYCTASELTRIERARLALRAEHRLGTDRGRIVRAALTEILDDFEARGPDSLLVTRLRELTNE